MYIKRKNNLLSLMKNIKLDRKLNKYFIFKLDRYAILMIPSSLIAFQVITAIIAVISLVTCGMTGYLLAFHIYLCKLNLR